MSLFLLAVLACAPIYAAPEQARAVARALWKKDHAIGMRRSQLNRACCFIDEIASKRPWQRVFSKKETGLPCDIERTAEPKGFMLTHLQGPFAKLGSGIHKVVMKALFYGPKPRVVAECIADESCAHEVEILKQLQGCRGIVPMLGYAVHPDNTYTIYLEYFRTGSLIKAIEDGVRFSTKQKLAIATDVLSGLHSLHERRLVHRDLHPGNILLRRCPSGLHAVLIDFDKTIDPKNATDQDIPQAPRTKNPPEALIQRFSTIDRYAADIYAMGCIFYCLEWGKRGVPWAKLFDVHALSAYTSEKKAMMYRQIGQRYEALKQKKIGAILKKESCGAPLTPRERFKVLTLAMLSFDPSMRPTSAEALYVSNTAFSRKR